jgi:hypothetical protein
MHRQWNSITAKQNPDKQCIASETALQQNKVQIDNTSPVKQYNNKTKSRQTIHHQWNNIITKQSPDKQYITSDTE